MDYNQIKALAKMQSMRATDLIVLAYQNDPFYCGSPAEVKRAEWFARLWDEFNYTKGVHLRRVHYRILHNPMPIIKPNGTPYENTQRDWDYLTQAGKHARYLGLVDLDAFDDRRNPEPAIYVQNAPEPSLYVYEPTRLKIQLPELPDFPSYEVEDFVSDQKYLIELWCEKTTMNDVLLAICEKHGLNLITAAGELSITVVKQFVDRVRESGRPGRILYISDFDPAGKGMPVAVARKLEWMIQHYGLECDIKLFPLVLTEGQCIKYKLPRTPIKNTDKRKENWEERYGEGATEPDALEAIVPGELERIIVDAVQPYFDTECVNENETHTLIN